MYHGRIKVSVVRAGWPKDTLSAQHHKVVGVHASQKVGCQRYPSLKDTSRGRPVIVVMSTFERCSDNFQNQAKKKMGTTSKQPDKHIQALYTTLACKAAPLFCGSLAPSMMSLSGTMMGRE
jgi:hypothetical protein